MDLVVPGSVVSGQDGCHKLAAMDVGSEQTNIRRGSDAANQEDDPTTKCLALGSPSAMRESSCLFQL